MKRMLVIGLMLMLVSMSMAAAQMTTTPIKLQNQTAMQIREHVESAEYYRQSNVDGLEQARLMVQSETAAQQVERNMNRIAERNMLMIQNMEEVHLALGENNTAIVQGKTQAKFLGFINANRKMTMVVDENGEIARIGRPLDFLFRYQETVREMQVE